ncbi:MAG: histidinol-phosphatase [candidate division WOR-3 bacterium]
MIDYHVHPDFSPDARGTVADYCQRALTIGLKELCFTTHCELDPARASLERVRVRGQTWPADSEWTVHYLEEIAECRRLFPNLVIRAGVEIGYEPGLEGIIADYLGRYSFDFVLGAVHCLDHIAVTAGEELVRFQKDYMHHGPVFIASRYFHYVNAMAGSGLFDAIAHLDIYRKYLVGLLGPDFYQAAERLMAPTLTLIAHAGIGLEVNTSGMRRQGNEPYPDEKTIRLAQQLGVKVWTVGSDAHRPEDLGTGIGHAQNLLRELGIEPARFERRKRIV